MKRMLMGFYGGRECWEIRDNGAVWYEISGSDARFFSYDEMFDAICSGKQTRSGQSA